MRIMEVVSARDINGVSVHCFLLTCELAKRGHDVTLLCRPGSWIAEQAADTPGITVEASNLERWPLRELRRMADIARVRQIDVIHTHMTRAHNFGIFLQKITGIPCIQTAHSHKVNPHWWLADHIIAVSDVTRTYHLRYNRISPHKIDTVHGFIDTSRFTPQQQDARNAVRTSLEISDDCFLLGVISDYLPRKGQIYLIQALPKLIQTIPGIRLAMAGSIRTPAYYSKVRASAKELGVEEYILWLGQRRDIPDLLQALDLYLLVSLDEMFPVGALEAMAAGRPVIATSVGGTPECNAVPNSIYLIPPASPDSIAEAVLKLYSDKMQREALGRKGAETVRDHFSVERQTDCIENVFTKVISSRKGGIS